MIDRLSDLLNKAIPNDKILADFWNVLNEDESKVEFKDDRWIDIPNGTKIDVITKAFLLESFEMVGFGTYKILLAIGGFNEDPNGFHTAKICFSTLFYSKNIDLITIDFHKDFK